MGYPEEVKGFDFSEKSIRQAFIRKVYSILMVQLAITAGFIALCVYHSGTRRFIQRSPGLLLVAMVVMIVTILAISCCENVRRKAPTNFIFLGIFTIASTFLVGVSSSRYAPQEVSKINLTLSIFKSST